MGAALLAALTFGGARPAESAFVAGFALSAVVALGAAVCALLVPRPRPA